MQPPDTKAYRFGGFTLDMRLGCLRLGDAPVPLRPKSFDVLLHLVRNPSRLVTKEELIEGVWPDVAVTGNSLVQCIKEVREVLGDEEQSMIETVARRGYRFRPAVVELDAARLEAAASEPAAQRPTAASPASPPAGSPPSGVEVAPVRSRGKASALAAAVAAAIAVAGALSWSLAGRDGQRAASPAGAAGKRLSVAVLPFVDSDAAASDDRLSRGIGEDIAEALGRFSDVAVASPKVVSRLRSVDTSAQDLERQLKVRYLVEGGIRRSADRIRITVRLTDLPQGVLVWSHAYDAPADAIGALEDDIAARIAGALAVTLTNLEAVRAARRSPGSMEAYDFVLRGRDLLTRLNRTTHSQARAMFERAIALDPSYPAAYVGLGRVDLSAAALGWTPDAAEALKRAEGLAHKAIALDEFSPAAHVLLGRVYTRSKEYDRAVEVLQRAVALNPSDPDCWAGLGDALLWRGDAAGAIRALENATAIDPRLSGEDLFSLGLAHFIAGNTAEATRVLERVTTRNEGNAFVYAMLAAVYGESAREAESRSAAAEVRKLNPFFDREIFGSLFNRPEHRERIAAALEKAGL
ncbi:MAG TPA: tetratricopeptide repeat protein [Anaeromyxobacter sp.]